jgi:hypothetical protein
MLNPPSWLAQRRFVSAVRRESDWVFSLDPEAEVVVECLWRLLEEGRIRITSRDDGEQFGLPQPIDAAAQLARCLAGAEVEGVRLEAGTLDLELRFSTGHVLQILPTSAGYEAWSATAEGNEYTAAVGRFGGEDQR